MRGVTLIFDLMNIMIEFLLTRLMRGVTGVDYREIPCTVISTHTPHARRDRTRFFDLANILFLLTRLMRGVTRCKVLLEMMPNISTHTPHARRDIMYFPPFVALENFYSHASCEA